MTMAKPNHKAARALMLQYLDLHPGQIVNNDLDPLEAGIVGDTSHADGGDSYHLGKDQTRARGTRNRYSVDESSRDSRGLDEHASAMDIGWFAILTDRGYFTLHDFNEWLIGLCRRGDPDTRDLREVIYSPDGRTVKRWDALGIRSTGDSSHTTHTHLSEFRDADGHRMLRLAGRWLQHIGLIPTEDDMPTLDEIAEAVWNRKEVDPADPDQVAGKKPPGLRVGGWARYEKVRADARQKAILDGQNAAKLRDAAILAAVQGVNEEAVLARVDQLARDMTKIPAATAAAIVDTGRPVEDTAAALKAVLGDRAAAVGRLLAGVTT